MIKMPDYDKFYDSKNRQVQSIAYGHWSQSFAVAKVNGIALKMAMLFKSSQASSFVNVYKKIIKSHKFSSFVEVDTDKPFFKWVAEPGQKFNGKNTKISTAGL